jgi:Icc-related predicted phosphoesterase
MKNIKTKCPYGVTSYHLAWHPMKYFFVTDLHGIRSRYEKLFLAIRRERPQCVFLGGDLLALKTKRQGSDFLTDYLLPEFRRVRAELGEKRPIFYVILGNDDPALHVEKLVEAEQDGLCCYVHGKKSEAGNFPVYGLAYVPPTPFRLKDWERYDVSRYVDPGCISPEDGSFSIPLPANEIKWTTIQSELAALTCNDPLESVIFLFHAPPYDTLLDRAALDGKQADGVEVDLHVGSIAIRRFIEERQPLLTLHGHVHESARLMGAWKTQIGRTVCINGAHDGPELALVRFDPHCPAEATRELI